MKIVCDLDKLQQALYQAQALHADLLNFSPLQLPYRQQWLCESFVRELSKKLDILSNHLYQSYLAYQQVEERIEEQVVQPAYFKKKGFDVDVYKHTSIRKDKSIVSYLKNGVCVGGLVRASCCEWNHQSHDFVSHKEKISVGNASIKGDAKCTFFTGKKFDLGLHLLAEANASIASAGVSVAKNYRFLQAEGSTKAQVGVASAQARALVDRNGIDLKAEVGVAAFKGEATGKITILGVSISTTGTYEVGSVGIGAEFTSKKGEFTFGGKASLFAGAGFKVHVDY